MKISQENLESGQYLTFSLRDEDFAINISKVREVLDVATLTKIPGMPEFISGVINLRGSVVPVMDLGHKLGMDQLDRTKNTSIIIAEIGGDENIVVMGALTDAVQKVVDLQDDEIEPVPRMGSNMDIDFIQGMGRQGDDKFLIILDIEHILASKGDALLQDFDIGLLTTAVAAKGAEQQKEEGAQAAF